MATQIVMDQTGDTRLYFNADDTEALSKAEERFKLLTAFGFTAAVRDADRFRQRGPAPRSAGSAISDNTARPR
jgi:hypothetical protein